jgi:type II secretory pathway pseudopilin PulG
MLLEVAVSMVVLGALLATVAQVIQWSAAEHRSAQRKRCALEAATTVLDRFTVLDWSAITPKTAAAIRLPAETVQSLIDPRLTVAVAEESEKLPESVRVPHDVTAQLKGAPPAKRISVEVSWANRPGGRPEHVRLSTWVFQRGSIQ